MGRLHRHILLVLAGLLLTCAPTFAVDITNFGDTTTTPPANSLRGAITGINASPPTASSPIRFIMGGVNRTINLVDNLPTINQQVNIEIYDSAGVEYDPANGPLVLTITGGGSSGRTALVCSQRMPAVNSRGIHTLRFSNVSTPLSCNAGNNSVTMRHIEVTGDGSNGIIISNAGTTTLESIYITGDRGGNGITISGSLYSCNLRGIQVQNQSGNGINITGVQNLLMESLAPNSFSIAAGGVTTNFPAARLHNFIGMFGNWGQGTINVDKNLLDTVVPLNPSMSGNPYNFGDIDGIGINIGESGSGNVRIFDTDVGNCDSHGIVIDPDNTISNVNLRRVRVGGVPDAYVQAQGGFAGVSSLHRKVVGDGIRIEGGRVDVTIGNQADVGFNYDDDRPLDADTVVDNTNISAVHQHATSDLGITVAAARNGAGIRVGLGDDPINGNITVRYARSGTDSTGEAEVVEGILDAGSVRRQYYGLVVQTNSGGSPLTVDNCQFTGNTRRGVELNGTARLTFNNNIIGANASAQRSLYSSRDPLSLGNGTRNYHEGTNFPASIMDGGTVTGDGVVVNLSGLIMGFYGNCIAGNARNGLQITSASVGTSVPPIGTGGIGDGTTAGWNYIGVQGRGLEAGRATFAPGPESATKGEKLLPAINPANNAETQPSSDPATGEGSGGTFFTPRVRGNGTTLFSNGGGTPASAVGDGFTYQGNGPCIINGITVSDSSRHGLILDTPQGTDTPAVRLVQARIGVGFDGITVADQSIGNGTIGRTPGSWNSILFHQGTGVLCSGDGDYAIGMGELTGFTTAQLRNVISSNLVYGVQLAGTVGVTGLLESDPANSNITVSNSYIGTDYTGTSPGNVTAEVLGFGNGHTRDNEHMLYPSYFGAGVRVEPNCDGRHLIGGDGSTASGAAGNNDHAERNVISNNGLVGVWLRGQASTVVVDNYIGASSNGNTVVRGAGNIQHHGVLIEQPEHFTHSSITGAGTGNNMRTQYVGWLPFTGLTNMNADPQNEGGGSGVYANVIVGCGIWGVGIEDNGNHTVVGNNIGVGANGTTALGNGGRMPLGLLALLAPQSFITGGGVSIGALNESATGQNVIGDDNAGFMFSGSDPLNTKGPRNLISANAGHGVAQYRGGIAMVHNNYIGTDVTGSVGGLGNTGYGVYLRGDGINQVHRNVIGSNAAAGIRIEGSGDNLFHGNHIGLNAAGTAALGNGTYGIDVDVAAGGDNKIGLSGTDTDAGLPRRNLIGGNARSGIRLSGPGGNVIRSNYIGLAANGSTVVGNGQGAIANDREGILIQGSGGNVIGGGTLDNNGVNTDANVITGNPGNGILITATTTTGGGNNTIAGNLIGLDATGLTGIGNRLSGISLAPVGAGAPSGQNLITQNVISSNTGQTDGTGGSGHGVFIHAAGQNTITGNRIGTNRRGKVAVGNAGDGIHIAANNSSPQLIGLANSGNNVFDNGNLIAGNLSNGIEINDGASHFVRGNWVGLGLNFDDGLTLAQINAKLQDVAALANTEFAAVPNAGDGLQSNATAAATLTIGGTLTGQFNVLSGNTGHGLNILGAATTSIRGNRLGLNPKGSAAIGNGPGGSLAVAGLRLAGSGASTVAENRIAGNNGPGVLIERGNNTLRLNRIGTAVTGDAALGNASHGVVLNDTGANAGIQVIGVATEGNVISGNGALGLDPATNNIGDGIQILGSGTYTIVSNLIGQNVAGNAAVPNRRDGIRVVAGSTGALTIGGTGANQENSIGGNTGYGLHHLGNQLPTIVNNRIGTNANGNTAIANQAGGVRFASASNPGTVVLGGATAGQGNVVSGNGGNGVEVAGTCGHVVQFEGNRIGTNLTGAVSVANGGHGVVIEAGNTRANVIGTAAAGNTISGNGIGSGQARHGVYLLGGTANVIENNSLGGDAAGASLAGGIGNTGDGVRIAAVSGTTVRNNTIRDNQLNGVGVLTGANERITNNRFIGNLVQAIDIAVTSGGSQVLDGITSNTDPLPKTNGAVNWPEPYRLVPNGANGGILSGRAPAQATSVEVYLAADLDTVPDPNPLKHHGGASQLLTTVTTFGPTTDGWKPFTASLVGLTGDSLVTALALDTTGNTSEFGRNIGFVNGTRSTVAAVPLSVDADGTAASTVTVTLADSISTPLQGLSDVSLAFSSSLNGGLLPPSNPLPATNAQGATSGQVRSTQPGTTDVTATSGGVALTTRPTINFVPAGIDPSQSLFEVQNNVTEVRANGTEQATFIFTIRDINGQPVAGVPATSLFVQATPTTGVTVVQPTAATDANGQSTASVTGTVLQQVVFRGFLGGQGGTELPSARTINFVSVPLDPNASTLDATPSRVAADNTTTATLTLTLVNQDGQPLAGVPAADIAFSANVGASNVIFENADTQSGNDGVFRATIRSNTVQTVTVTASVRGTVIPDTAQVEFTAGDSSAASSSMTVTPTTAIANGQSLVQVDVLVRDTEGRPKANEPVAIVVEPSVGVTINQPAPTDVSGVTSGTFSATIAGQYQVRVNVGPAPGSFGLGPETVTFTATPPDAGRSSVGLSSTAIVADNTETSTVNITLLNAQGEPLQGVQPAEVAVNATYQTGGAPGGVTVNGPVGASDSLGRTSATIRGSAAGTVLVQVVARGVTLSQTATLTLRDFADQNFIIGTHLMGVPVQPLDTNPAVVFSGLLPGLRLARYVPSQGQYLQYTTGTTAEFLQVEPGRGFWLQLSRAFDLRVTGTRTAAGPFTAPTSQGWNMLANPYPGALAMRLDQIEVLQNDQLVGTMNSAAGRALVAPYFWQWDPVLGYLLVIDPTQSATTSNGMIAAGRGFWALVTGPNVSLRFAGPAAAGRGAISRQTQPNDWLMAIQAEAAGTVSRANLLGIGSQPLVAVLPPESPEPTAVSLHFLDTAGRAVATDIRAGRLTGRTRWDAVVEAPANSEVTLSWPGASRALPERHRAWLLDPTTGRRVLMNTRASYQYRQGDGARQFVIEVDPRGDQTLAVTAMTVNTSAGRSRAVPVQFTVTAPAEVVVQVKGLSGTVVRTLRDSVDAGTSTIGWDRKDEQGRLVPGGVYSIELTATTEAGEIVRVTRQVRL